nr:prolyl endopeptidase [Ciona intestinalis]|eukprot:XP_026689406.1 prolyl endopeptidase [Ciona intestinalis]
MALFKYPEPRKDESAIENYHGTKISDPYKWMEDPDCEETKSFVAAQNEISIPYLKECSVRNQFEERLTELYNYPKYSCPKKRGSKYFYFLNTGLQNQSVMYVQDSLDSEPKVFFDPNKLSDDGTISLSRYSFSEDGSKFCYGLSQSGSDWVTLKFKDVESGEDMEDVLNRVKFSCMSWTHDGKGLFYNSYLEQKGKADGTETTSNVDQKLFYHRIGEKQESDILCAEFPENPKWMSGAEISDDGNYIILQVSRGCDPVNQLWYADIREMGGQITKGFTWVKLVDNFDAEYDYITNGENVFTFKTNLDAPKYKLITIDINNPDMKNWRNLIPEHEKDVLEWTACVNQNKLVVCYLRDVKSVLELRHLADGSLIKQLPLDVGSVVGYSGRKDQDEIFYMFMSFLTPGVIYRYDFNDQKPEPKVFRRIEVKGFNPDLFTTKQVFYASKDGTKIPMFIVHKKDIELTGDHPTLLYGYGGFSISITPSYSVSRVIFMQNLGGLIAVANIRGGGEYGETWHKAGSVRNKQNCFDDFQSAAQFLTDNKYTRPSKLTINGGSNGGLLVGACINQRPELFGCAVAQVGVMDMLKFHKYTIGHAWTTDYGCSDDCDDFNCLVKYSPLHNVKSVPSYPSLLLLTGDHDDRVVPHHSLKYIATLQDLVGRSPDQRNPLLIRVDTKSGHGSGKPTSKIIEEASDMYGFIARCVEAHWSD